jgi:hypothetical protein
LLPVMLLISVVLGVIPLAGVAWIFVSGTWETVDGLFEILIMLSLSGVFFLNVFWELRDKGMFGKKGGGSSSSSASDES